MVLIKTHEPLVARYVQRMGIEYQWDRITCGTPRQQSLVGRYIQWCQVFIGE